MTEQQQGEVVLAGILFQALSAAELGRRGIRGKKNSYLKTENRAQIQMKKQPLLPNVERHKSYSPKTCCFLLVCSTCYYYYEFIYPWQRKIFRRSNSKVEIYGFLVLLLFPSICYNMAFPPWLYLRTPHSEPPEICLYVIHHSLEIFLTLTIHNKDGYQLV